jgi:steroid delta-isomerase-like uncharacterized protein
MVNDVKQIARRTYEELWNKGNLNYIEESFDPDYQGYIALAGKLDREGLKATVTQYRKSFPDLRFDIKDQIVEGDKVMVRWIASGTHKGLFMGQPPTGNPASVHGFTLFEFRNGRVVKDRSEFDELALFKGIGVELPAVPMIIPHARPEARR